VTGNEATVKTRMRAGGGHDLRVEYGMAVRDGRWCVRDIVLDGVSTVENYHAQFRRVLQRGGYAALTAQLRDRVRAESWMFARMEPRVVPPAEVAAVPVADLAAPPREAAPPTPAPPPDAKSLRRDAASNVRRGTPVATPASRVAQAP
jgi:hypothetical protein